MSNFERITASPDVLGEFLASLPVAAGPWDEDFRDMVYRSYGKVIKIL